MNSIRITWKYNRMAGQTPLNLTQYINYNDKDELKECLESNLNEFTPNEVGVNVCAWFNGIRKEKFETTCHSVDGIMDFLNIIVIDPRCISFAKWDIENLLERVRHVGNSDVLEKLKGDGYDCFYCSDNIPPACEIIDVRKTDISYILITSIKHVINIYPARR